MIPGYVLSAGVEFKKLFIFFLKSKQIISVSINASYRKENKIQRRKKESNETEMFWLLSVV